VRKYGIPKFNKKVKHGQRLSLMVFLKLLTMIVILFMG